ncbi:sulfite exporter TauE/SafE family protein [Roseococcus sp. DSY-14]|uniref:sulfite exporter TauE/SafE family protein n=1 Tax=Roseococcus sp. DSY-14 TaxID=3369650 RepID=UPI00387AFCED
MLITDPWFYALAVPAFLLTGISKGGFASGAGNTGVPLMSLVIPAPQAAGIALPVLCAMDLVALRAWWGRWDAAMLRSLLPGAALGIALGWAAFGLLPDSAVKLLVGALTLAFLLRAVLAGGKGAAPAPAPSRARRLGLSAGSGFASFIAHAGGPPMAMLLFPLRLPRATLSATTVAFFATVNFVKLLPYGLLGVLSAQNLLTSLVLLPLAPLGIRLGVALSARISDRTFYRIVHALLLATSLQLIWEGLARH